MPDLTIATRGSKLALWQAGYVRERILASRPEVKDISLLVLKTKGDKILDVPLAKIGGKGLFVKEIEEALLDGRADIAVHSMKDVPMELPPTLTLAAIMEREDARDMFLSMRHKNLDALPPGSRVGTSSLRRQAQILAARPDLTIIPLRGNVDTRLAKLVAGEFDAIIMAAAGIKRLNLHAPCMEELPERLLLPAAGQGALGVECRRDRADVLDILACLDHTATRVCVMAERGVLSGLEGGCQTPIAAHAVIRDDTLSLSALLCGLNGETPFRETATMDPALGPDAAHRLGSALAATLKASGGGALLATLLAAADVGGPAF